MSGLSAVLRRLLSDTLNRARARASERPAAFLAEASRVLATSLEYETTLTTVARLAVPYFADWCAVDLVGRDGSTYRVVLAHTDPTKGKVALNLQRRYPFDPDAPYGASYVLRTGRSELYPEITDAILEALARDAEHLEKLRHTRPTSGICVPLMAKGRTLGALSFGSTRVDRLYNASDLSLAEDLARRAALAVDNARLYAEVRENEAWHRAIVETALDAIITIDHEGRIVELNRAAERTFGYSAAQAVGRQMAELIIPPSLRERHRRGFARYLASGEGSVIDRRVEMMAMRADGSEFPVEVAMTRMNLDGSPRFTGHVHDISERTRAQAAERQAAMLQSVTELATAAAHEINNPLMVIIGNLSLSLRDRRVDAHPPLQDHIDRALSAARAIQDIVARMGRITRLEGVSQTSHLAPMLDIRKSSGEEPAR